MGADGTIVTSHHVIKDAQEIKVVLSDKREFPAKVIARDPQSDLALLKIDAHDLPHLELRDSDTLEVGDLVLAIGNPFGVGQTVTSGISYVRAWRARLPASPITSSSSRPTPPSTPAIPAVRWSICRAV